MNYYYDLELNFLDKYYPFYEWSKEDIIEIIKKIPLFLVSEHDFMKMFQHEFILNENILKLIKDKTLGKKKIEYAMIICDKKNTLAIQFDENGKSIFRSSLTYTDDENINEVIYTIKESKLDYQILDKIDFNNEMRVNENIKKVIMTEVRTLNQEKNYQKLRYLYLEWFGINENRVDVILKNISDRLNSEIGNSEIEIYNLIKLSYNRV